MEAGKQKEMVVLAAKAAAPWDHCFMIDELGLEIQPGNSMTTNRKDKI